LGIRVKIQRIVWIPRHGGQDSELISDGIPE